MNADLTYNSVVFARGLDESGGSKRQSNARGINTPDVMTVKSQDYTDSKTKVPGRRRTVRLEHHDLDANGDKNISSASFTLQIPSTAEDADVTEMVTTFKAMVANADLIADVLNEEV